jgi:hypothetical protein
MADPASQSEFEAYQLVMFIPSEAVHSILEIPLAKSLIPTDSRAAR